MLVIVLILPCNVTHTILEEHVILMIVFMLPSFHFVLLMLPVYDSKIRYKYDKAHVKPCNIEI